MYSVSTHTVVQVCMVVRYDKFHETVTCLRPYTIIMIHPHVLLRSVMQVLWYFFSQCSENSGELPVSHAMAAYEMVQRWR